MDAGCTPDPSRCYPSGLVSQQQATPISVRFGYMHIGIYSFSETSLGTILPVMSIRNVKIDLISAVAMGAFSLYLLSPLLS